MEGRDVACVVQGLVALGRHRGGASRTFYYTITLGIAAFADSLYDAAAYSWGERLSGVLAST